MTTIGVLGAGMIGNVHAAAAKAIGTNIAAVYDPRQEKAEKFSKEHSCDIADSVASLVQNESIDGVVIAVPNDQHATLAIEALTSGKHVLLEKPMAMSLEQCDAILQARETTGKVLQMGFVCRYSPAALRAKELVSSGVIGEVLHVQCTLLRQRGIPGIVGRFTTKERSGGG